MRAFLNTVAVLIGSTNALFYNALGESPWGGPFVWRFQLGPLFAAHMLSAILVGLVVSNTLYLLAGHKLRANFPTRYGLMVAAICVGGAVLGAFLYNSIIMFDVREPAPQGLFETLFALVFPAVLGATLGAVEGVVLGLPLAGSLGLFGDHTVMRAQL